MELPTETIDDIVVVTFPHQRLGVKNFRQFETQMLSILSSEDKVVLDLSALRFIDSSGVGSILSCLQKARSDDRQMRICCVHEQVNVIFRLVCMERVANVDKNRQDALLALKD